MTYMAWRALPEYGRHSSQNPVTTQASPLRQSRGYINYQTLKVFGL